MNIGYSVEGSTDRAILRGLKERWCPQAVLIEGRFRGQTGHSRRRELTSICIELQAKGVDLMVFLCDSNVEDWRDVLQNEEARCPREHAHLAVFGVCLRNAESWLAADPGHISRKFGRSRAEFIVEDPKAVVASVFGVCHYDKKEDDIADFVRSAPLRNWLSNPSFKDFYEKLRRKSHELACDMENLLDVKK